MTCIVAVASGGKVYMGADSAGVSGLDLRSRIDVKTFIKDGLNFGCTSSFRMIQLLQYSLVVPKRHPETGLHKYMCTDFIDAVRRCLKAGGFASKDKDTETGGCFLVGIEGNIFRIDSDYQVGRNLLPFDAVGCGESYAIAALYATSSHNMKPLTRLQLALTTAQEFSAGVRSPFVFTETEK